MTVAIDVLLGCSILAAWLGSIAYVRLRTPLEQLHVVTFINIAMLAPIVVAAFLADGSSSRALKCGFIFFVMLVSGALSSQATGRALHRRDGEWR